jgi:hypothetical protein
MNIAKLKIKINENFLYFSLFLFFLIFYLYNSPLIILRFGHDVIHYLDILNRLDFDQNIHNDFSNPVGAFFFEFLFLFSKIFNNDIIFFSIANASFCGIIILYFCINKLRLNFYINFVFFITLLLMSFSLNHIGIDNSNTYANLYNRWGYLLVLATFGNLFLVNTNIFHQLVLILFIITTLFIKHSFFIAQSSILLFYYIFKEEKITFALKKFFAIILISVFCFFLIAFLLDYHILNLLYDYALPGKVRIDVLLDNPEIIFRKFFPYGHFFSRIMMIIIECLMIVTLIYSFRYNQFKHFLILFFIALNVALMHVINYGYNELAIAIIYLFLFYYINNNLIKKKFVIFITLLIIFTTPSLFKYFTSYYLNIFTEINNDKIINLEKYKNLKIVNADGIGNEKYKEKIQDGCNLSNKYTKGSIYMFNFENFLNLCQNTEPKKNIKTLWAFGTTYSYNIYRNFNNELKEFDYFMIATPYDEDTGHITKIYYQQMKKNFTINERSKYWSIYKKIKK